MLTRLPAASAATTAAALLLTLAPPLTDAAEAAAPKDWASRFAGDLIEAQQVSKGEGVKIALLSDGVAPGMRTLSGALEKGRDLVRTPRPKPFMGTLTATMLVGSGPTARSPLGVRGVVSDATLLPVRVYPGEQTTAAKRWWDEQDISETVAQGIRHAADQGARIIAVEPAVEDVEAYATTGGMVRSAIVHAANKGAVVVAAAAFKNEPARPGYPAAAAGVLGVGTTDAKGRREKKYTAASTAISVSAPGIKVPTTGPGDRPYEFWGPSVALAWVTAAVAMIRSEYPKLTPPQVVEAVTSSARHPKGRGRYDTELGYGYLSAMGAMTAARALADKPAPATTPAVASAVKDAARFGGDDPPGAVRAVPYDPALLGGFGGLIVAGLVAIGLALALALRRPRPTPAAPGATSSPLGGTSAQPGGSLASPSGTPVPSDGAPTLLVGMPTPPGEAPVPSGGVAGAPGGTSAPSQGGGSVAGAEGGGPESAGASGP
ncbi:S8 family serine peptidase [Spirillospora sp. CA-255316]